MHFGLFGSAQAKRGGPDVDSGQGFKDYVEYNVEAESLGFTSTFVVEHHFTGFGQVSASLNLLTWVGARTSTLRLGTAVIVLPWHNPVLLAEQAATIDLMSDGRLEFGVGKGYRHNEFASFCIPPEQADERFEEGLALIVKCLTSLAQAPDGKNRSSMMTFADTREATEESAFYDMPDKIAQKLERLRAVGVEHVLLNGPSGSREHLRRFAREVMPAFVGLPGRNVAAE